MITFDFGRYSDDYATWRPGPPASFYARLDALAAIQDSRAVDLATGPGTIAMELAERGATVVGIDTSDQQIGTAARVAAERGLRDRIDFRVALAEDTGLDAGAYDLATAGQCWHWFDREAAMQELHRILRPGGLLAIVSYSYLSLECPIARDTEALILELNPAWTRAGYSGMSPDQIDDVIRGGFRLAEVFCYDNDEEFSHERWRGRMRTCSGVGSGVLSSAEVERFDEALALMLAARYPDPMTVRHRVWCVAARTPS